MHQAGTGRQVDLDAACARAKALAGVTWSSSSTLWRAVIINADLISGTVQVGWIWRSSAAAPAWCGDAMEVPLIRPMVFSKPVSVVPA